MNAENNNQTDKYRFVGEWVRLGDVATYINGYAFKPSDYSDTGLPIIRIQDLTGNAYQTNRYEGILSERYAVDDGDILISWSASLGVFEWDGGPAWLNQHIFKVSFDKMQVDKRFFVHQARFLMEASANLAHGATMRHLTKKVFDSLPFYFPRSERQRAIADQLDGIDMQLCNATNQLYQLDSLVKSRFVEMFGDPTLPSPLDWEYCKLGEVLLIERGGSPRPIKSYLTNSPRGINWIKIGDADEGSRFIVSTKEKICPDGAKKSRRVEQGDFILSNSMSFGRPYILKTNGCIHDGWLVLRDQGKRFEKLWLYEALSSQQVHAEFQKLARGGVVNNLNRDLVASVPILIPPKMLQLQFTDFVVQVDKLRFAGNHEMNFQCDRFTLSWSTMA